MATKDFTTIPSHDEQPPQKILLAFAIISLLICSGLLVYGAGRGMDLTDEIFYLIWTRDPNAYALSYQPFGYLLNPLFKLVAGDLRVYRLVGIAIVAATGAFLGWSLSRRSRDRTLISVYGAVSGLTIFFPWIITPSYNSAANVGAMLMIAGILNALADWVAQRVVGAVAAASGLCVAAFSKPPLFVIGVAVILVVAFMSGTRRTAFALISVPVLAAVFISLFLAPAEIPALVRGIIVSQHVLALPNTPLQLPAKLVRDWNAVPLALSGAAAAAALSFALPRPRWSQWSGYLAIALSLYYVGDVAADAIDGSIPDFLGLALVISAAGYAAVLRTQQLVNLPTTSLLLAAPLAVALGTFNNQWFQFNFSLAFPFLALFTLASSDRKRWRRIAAQVFCIAGPAAAMFLAACYPYSLPASLFEQQIPIEHPLTHSIVLVDSETASFVRSGRGIALGARLVDLSGTGPGVGVVLGAAAPVLAWLNPAVPTWPDVVWSRLSPEERERVWFVGPVWPAFDGSAPARWLLDHHQGLCEKILPPITFWGEQRHLRIWRPCNGASLKNPVELRE